MIHPDLGPFRSLPLPDARAWRGATGSALIVTAMGTVVGSTLSSFLGSKGMGWGWAEVIVTPLTALTAAASVYGQYRHLPLDNLQTRIARVLVSTGGVMVLASVTLARPTMAAAAIWFMTAITVIVTALAAGAGGSRQIDDTPLPWANSA